ncbi:MAG: hypothetical protein ACOY99_11290 [Pseudomonadota bacterium]
MIKTALSTDRLAQADKAYRAALAAHLAGLSRQLAEKVAMDARTNVLAGRDPARPLPSTLAESIAVIEDGAAVKVVAAAPHAGFVEFGTARQPARPFLGPAALAARLTPDDFSAR